MRNMLYLNAKVQLLSSREVRSLLLLILVSFKSHQNFDSLLCYVVWLFYFNSRFRMARKVKRYSGLNQAMTILDIYSISSCLVHWLAIESLQPSSYWPGYISTIMAWRICGWSIIKLFSQTAHGYSVFRTTILYRGRFPWINSPNMQFLQIL